MLQQKIVLPPLEKKADFGADSHSCVTNRCPRPRQRWNRSDQQKQYDAQQAKKRGSTRQHVLPYYTGVDVKDASGLHVLKSKDITVPFSMVNPSAPQMTPARRGELVGNKSVEKVENRSFS